MKTHQPVLYTYFINADGQDQLRDTILTPDGHSAKKAGNHILKHYQDPDINGSVITITDPREFIDRLTHGNPHQRDQYFGYYYDETVNQYVLVPETSSFSYDSAISALGDYTIDHQLINEKEITDTLVDGEIKDLENVLFDHECDVVKLAAPQIKNYCYRAHQILP